MTVKQVSILIFILLAAIAAVVFSLTGKSELEISNEEQFIEYVSAYTTGIISRESTIKIRLVQEYREGESNEIPAELNILKFEPSIKGETYWLDNQTIEFLPEKKLEPDTRYSAVFNIDKIIRSEKKLDPFIFNFQTIKRQLEVEFHGFTALSNKSTEFQKLTGSIETSDVEDIQEIRKILTAEFDDDPVNIIWFPGTDRKQHKFVIDSLKRDDDELEVNIEWDGSPIGIDGSGNKQIFLPPIDEFNVSSVKVIHTPDQYISLIFTDPLNRTQNFEGLISIDNISNLRFETNYNEVKIYPPNRLLGEFSLNVDQGIKNSLNYRLNKKFKSTLTFENFKPAVKLIGQGVIIPENKHGFVLPFEAVNLSSVDVLVTKIFEDNMAQFLQVNNLEGGYELKRVGKFVLRKTVRLDQSGTESLHKWNRFTLDLNELSNEEVGVVYRVQIGFRKSQSLYFCSNEKEDETDRLNLSENFYEDNESSYWDYYDNYYYYGYDWQHRDDPCHQAYYGNRRSVSKNIIHSNIGIIAKKGTDGSLFFATTNIATGKPQSSVYLHLLDYQKQELSKLVTNTDGIAQTKIDDKIYMVIAEKGDEKGYLRMDDGSSLSISRFDVSGSAVKKGIKGFIYGDRGVWRPGDSLFITFILEDLNNNIPAKHPLVFEIKNPKQQLVSRIVEQRNKSDFYTFKFATETDAPTGNWSANISLGGINFNKPLKIETIKPNRLKIKFDLAQPYLTKKTESEVLMSVNWLHGAAGKNLKAKIDATLSKTTTKFNKYSDYTFDDPTKQFESEPQTIFEGTVDEQGKAKIKVDINLKDAAPGKLQANFLTKAFEPGGDFSIDKFSIDYYPYNTYVGIKLPKGDNRWGMLYTGKDHKVEVVTLDIEGNPVSNRRVELKLHKVSWRWWWDQSQDYQSNYSSNFFEYQLDTKIVTTINGKAEWKINIKEPDWGRFIVTAKDLDGQHQTGKIVYLDWPGWAGRARKDQPDGASMLTFSANKEKYDVGDEVELTIPGGESGRSLISIESGSKVIDSYWLEMKKGENKFTFKATEEMTPNVYANVTLIQPHSQTENDLPIRLYGIIPIYIENPETHLTPQILMPDVLRPEESFTLKVKEKSSRKMTYTIAVVDEGLLDLTRFKTPDPWTHFYSKEALGVKTWDLFDMVIGAYGGKLEHLLSLGGGEFQKSQEGTKVNRFKPVVKFLGPFTIDGDEGIHKIDVPRYVGSVRTMVIAGNKGAYGFDEKTTPVRKPLMVLGTLPRVLGPGETVELPISVFAMEDNVKDVSVFVKPNELFEIEGSSSKQISFNEKGDQLVNFKLKVKQKTGIGRVDIEAKSGNENALYNIELEIRNPNPIVVDVISEQIEEKGEWNQSVKSIGVEGTNKCILEISAIPPLNLGERLNYLIRYPHGCIEQTVSGAFPQLYLNDLVELSDHQKTRTEQNIKTAINRLNSFQISTGGLSYWPGGRESSEWGTTYAGHFLIEALNKGYDLPSGFLTKWKNYQVNEARNWSKKANRSDLSQAYRLYTLALMGEPELGAMNRLLSSTDLSKTAKFRLAASYQLAGKPEAAENLIKSLDYNIEDYAELGNTFGSGLRDKGMILETLDIMGKRNDAFVILKTISEELNLDRWYSTQTTAYALLAVGKFIGANDKSKEMNFEYSVNGENRINIVSTKPIVQEMISLPFNEEKIIKVKNNTAYPLFGKIILEGKPITGDQTDASNKLDVSVSYYLLDGKNIDPSSLDQGTDFVAEVTVTHPGKNIRNYEQMELHQIFPSGWEIINTRLIDMEYFTNSSSPQYQDIRDDRVYTYYNLNTKQSKTFRLLLNASYLGKFYLPTVYSQAMYDNTINARRHGQWVEVVLPGK